MEASHLNLELLRDHQSTLSFSEVIPDLSSDQIRHFHVFLLLVFFSFSFIEFSLCCEWFSSPRTLTLPSYINLYSLCFVI